MPDELRCRAIRPEEEARARQIFREGFGRDLGDAWWHWFHHECPLGPARISVVEDTRSGGLAALYTMLPLRIRQDGRVRKASLAVNAAVHPNYRRRGLFTRLGQFVLQREAEEFDTPITIGKPNASAVPGHVKVGWDILGALSTVRKTELAHTEHLCRRVQGFDERFDGFFQEIASSYDFIVMRDLAFQRWRYRRPDATYVYYVLEHRGHLTGYVVLKRFRDDTGYEKVHVIEMQGQSDGDVAELLKAAESWSVGADELSLWTNQYDPYRPQLDAAGFAICRDDEIIIHHTNSGTSDLPRRGAWYFSYGDNDVH